MLLPHLSPASLLPGGTAAPAGRDGGTPPRRIRVQQRSSTYAELAAAAGSLALRLPAGGRAAVVAEREIETVVAVVAGLLRGTTLIPVNPAATVREVRHIVQDSEPDLVLLPPASAARLEREEDDEHPLAALPRHMVEAPAAARHDTGSYDRVHDHRDDHAAGASALPVPDPEGPALVMYTSGTTGPPKGAVLSHRAIAANLDMLAQVWAWSPDDVLVHALPLYHVHGLVLGVLGPLRIGSGLHHLGTFDPAATAEALRGGGSMHFGVPTIYHRLAEAAAADDAVASALAGARLLVSGSAGLPMPVHEHIRELTGQTVVERYGMTETMITTAVPAGVVGKAGTVGPALPGVELRVLDDQGEDVAPDGAAMGEIVVRSPAMFSGYLGRTVDTAGSAVDPSAWFRTGDTATIDADGYVRIVGRSSVDIIKSGGFKIGAGEIEDALLEHADVAEVAVRGVPDDELGERVVAWVVLRPGATTSVAALIEHARTRLSRHKQPRTVVLTDALPRNPMGKVQKSRLDLDAIDTSDALAGGATAQNDRVRR